MERCCLLLVVCTMTAAGCSQTRQPATPIKPAEQAAPAPAQAAPKAKVLFYSQSFGFRHSVVTRPLTGELSHAEKIMKEILAGAGYQVSLSQDCNDLKNEDQFKQFDAIVLYTSGDPDINRKALLKWLRAGGALIGIHAATDTFKGWPEYVQAMGAAFKTHGHQGAATLKIEVADHPATAMLEQGWTLLDEYYLFKEDSFSRENVRVLISVDAARTPEADLKPMAMAPGGDYPVAWTNTEGQGRVFYSSLGHREDVWTNPAYQKHLLGGIAWSLGKHK